MVWYILVIQSKWKSNGWKRNKFRLSFLFYSNVFGVELRIILIRYFYLTWHDMTSVTLQKWFFIIGKSPYPWICMIRWYALSTRYSAITHLVPSTNIFYSGFILFLGRPNIITLLSYFNALIIWRNFGASWIQFMSIRGSWPNLQIFDMSRYEPMLQKCYF